MQVERENQENLDARLDAEDKFYYLSIEMQGQPVAIKVKLLTNQIFTIPMRTTDTIAKMLVRLQTEFKRQHGYKPLIGSIHHKGYLVDPDTKIQDVFRFDPNDFFYIMPIMGSRVNSNPLNLQNSYQKLEAKFSDPAFLQKRMNMRILRNISEEQQFPENIQRSVGKYLDLKMGGKSRKTRKSKKSRRQTRRRR